MKKNGFLIVLYLYCNTLIAQDNLHDNAFWNDANGRPLKLNTDFRVEGSPFFYDAYCAADVYLANGKKYENVKVKLNVVDNLVLFENAKGEEMETVAGVKRIHFYSFLNGGNAYEETVVISNKPIINEKGNELFSVLVDSNTKLLKKIKINFTDDKPYNAAVITRTYTRSESLYLQKGNSEPEKLQKNKAAVLELLGNKYKQLNEFIEKNRLKCRNEKEIAQVVAYYNTLK